MRDLVSYNGYNFNEYSDLSVTATMQDDDTGRVTSFLRYKIRVESTIYAEDGDRPGEAGLHFRRVRNLLSQKGRPLTVFHRGFDGGEFSVNQSENPAGQRDVTFGPHPRLISWEPSGHENAVHIVWECEVCVPECCCGKRWTGIMAMGYGITTRIDASGYTTRTITGYIEIAMTRAGKRVPDTADAYRDMIIVAPLPNFSRESSWTLSQDKRRAEYSITDSQIRSPNAFPPGVISIRATHSANWSKNESSKSMQNIRATIELAQNQPRSLAWEIFRAIVELRTKKALVGLNGFFVQALGLEEDLYGNSFTFSITVRTWVDPNKLFSLPDSIGMGTPVVIGTWGAWKQSIANLQSHGGQAKLIHSAGEPLVDMCTNSVYPEFQDTSQPPYAPGAGQSARQPFSVKPSPKNSYIKYDTWLEFGEETPTVVQVSMGEDDLKLEDNGFDPNKSTATLGDGDTSVKVERFIETQSGRIEIRYRGYAERVGYPIPRPDKLFIKIGGAKLKLKRIGKTRFMQHQIGVSIGGYPIYAAAWDQRYVLTNRPVELTGINDWDDI